MTGYDVVPAENTHRDSLSVCSQSPAGTRHATTTGNHSLLGNIAVFIVNDLWVHIIIIVLIILNQNKFLSQHLFSSLMMWAGQPVTHMRSANSKPQPSNQFPTDKIKPRPHLILFQKRFAVIYGTAGKKRLSQLLFHDDFRTDNLIDLF